MHKIYVDVYMVPSEPIVTNVLVTFVYTSTVDSLSNYYSVMEHQFTE